MKPAHEELMEWAQEELEHGNRIKASRIQKAAECMKARYEAEEERRASEIMHYY